MVSHYSIGDTLDVKIEKIVPRGLGLGFAEGLTVFVSLSVPGDVLRVRVRELKKRMAFAEIVEILEPGPTRITPPCPYFGTCGGCDFQQMDYASQLAAKVEIIRDSLHRISKIDLEREIAVVRSPKEFEYRSRVRWHLDRVNKRIGYFARNSHEVIDIDQCPKITAELNKTLAELRSEVEWGSFWSDMFDVEAAEGDDSGVSVFSPEFADEPVEIASQIGDSKFHYTAQTFFQANRSILESLTAVTLSDLSGETALDLYSGIGFFALPLARRFKMVTAVEENGNSSEFARRNADLNGLANIEFATQGVEEFISSYHGPSPDLVLLDPPRSGTEKRTIPLLVSLRPARIVYVSCDPGILARDLRILVDGGFKIDSVTAVDIFPQTHHIETVLHLSRVST